ncbi:MAG: PorT family protein [Bacteroidales bacterium]|nr:PorT family protein [Bacteroidales bacterium]MCI2144625.1 PorT family protein [Bacteroidales bacterium]
MGMTTANAQMRYGAHLGAVHTAITSKTEYMPANDFSGGAVLEYDFNAKADKKHFLAVHFEINYSTKSNILLYPSDDASQSVIDKYEYSLAYLDMPLSLGYSINLGNHFRIVPRLGGYFSYGLSGDGFIESSPSGHPLGVGLSCFEGGDAKWEDQTFHYEPFNRSDAGLTGGIDLFFDRFFISCSYQYGLRKLITYNNSGALYFRNTYLTVGFLF